MNYLDYSILYIDLNLKDSSGLKVVKSLIKEGFKDVFITTGSNSLSKKIIPYINRSFPLGE